MAARTPVRAGLATLALLLFLLSGCAEAAGSLDLAVDRPAALRWDAGHHAGALAADDQVWVIHEDGQGLQLAAKLSAPGVAHLAVGLDDGSIYASASEEGTLKRISLADGRLNASVPSGGPRPASLLYNPILKRLASFNAGAGTVTLFDTASNSFEGLIPLGDAPVAVQLSPDGRVLALLPERLELVLLGMRPLRIFARWPLPAECTHPRDLALDSARQQVFVACGSERIAHFSLVEGSWQANWWGGAPGLAVVQLFWDGPRARLLAVTDAGSVQQAEPTAAAARALVTLPAGTLFDWDANTARLLVLKPSGAGLHSLAFISLP